MRSPYATVLNSYNWSLFANEVFHRSGKYVPSDLKMLVWLSRDCLTAETLLRIFKNSQFYELCESAGADLRKVIMLVASLLVEYSVIKPQVLPDCQQLMESSEQDAFNFLGRILIEEIEHV